MNLYFGTDLNGLTSINWLDLGSRNSHLDCGFIFGARDNKPALTIVLRQYRQCAGVHMIRMTMGAQYKLQFTNLIRPDRRRCHANVRKFLPSIFFSQTIRQIRIYQVKAYP